MLGRGLGRDLRGRKKQLTIQQGFVGRIVGFRFAELKEVSDAMGDGGIPVPVISPLIRTGEGFRELFRDRWFFTKD